MWIVRILRAGLMALAASLAVIALSAVSADAAVAEDAPEVDVEPVGGAASTAGAWTAPINLPLVPVAMVNLPSGKVLMFSAQSSNDFAVGNGATETALYDPETGAISRFRVSNTGHDMFCPGITNMPDGRIAVTGGKNVNETSIYDPASDTWLDGPDMTIGRGYQSGVTLHDGTSFTFGGSWSGGRGNKVAEIFDGRNYRRLNNIRPENGFLTGDSAGVYRSDNHMWLFPWGDRVFHAGPSRQMNWIDLEGEGAVTPVGNRAADGHSMNGTAVMFAPGKILTVGGSPNYDSGNGTRAAHIIDIAGSQVTTRRVEDINRRRTLHHSVVLPSGEVVVVGGQEVARLFTDNAAVYEAEIFDPETETFTTGASMQIPRTYHSAAILLRDGRVMVGGGGLCGGRCPGANHPDAEIYAPPYLFDDNGAPAARPTLTSVPSSVGFGETIEVESADAVAFSLVRLSNSTHSVNIEQRRIPLSIAGRDGDRVAVTMPANGGVAPPGKWFLFAMNAQGTPSVAEVVTLGSIDCGADMVFDPATIRRFGGQDEGQAEVLDDGAAIRVFDNGWKAIDLAYTVGPNTVLEFDFRSSIEGEEHAIGFSNSLSGAATQRRFKLWGTQNTNNDAFQDFADYAGDGSVQRYSIPIGQYFTGWYRYLVVSADDDAADAGESIFSNVRIRETGPGYESCAPGAEPAEIGGQVTNEDGSPRAGIKVDLFSRAEDGSRGEFLGFANTGADGRYGFDELAAGCYVLTFIAPDGELFSNNSRWFQPSLCVEDGEARSDVDATFGVPIGSRGALTGSVTFADLSPAEGVKAVLYAAAADGGRGAFVGPTFTGADGVYRFDVEDGCYVIDLVAPADTTFGGLAYRQLSGCVEDASTVDGLDGVLSRSSDLASVGGTVTAADGAPVVGVKIDLFRTAEDGSRGSFLGFTRTGDDGSYEFTVDPVCHTLTFIAPDGETFAGSRWLQPTACPEAGETITDLDATLD